MRLPSQFYDPYNRLEMLFAAAAAAAVVYKDMFALHCTFANDGDDDDDQFLELAASTAWWALEHQLNAADSL